MSSIPAHCGMLRNVKGKEVGGCLGKGLRIVEDADADLARDPALWRSR
jgi:hypothetical protein